MKYFTTIIALALFISNVSNSIPLRDVEDIDITALKLDIENKQQIETLLGLRAAYRDALDTIDSYNISYGIMTYISEKGMDKREKLLGSPKFVYANQPIGSLYNMKRYGSRFITFEENINSYNYWLVDGTEKLLPTKEDRGWLLIDHPYRIFSSTIEINGEKFKQVGGKEADGVDLDPFIYESGKLWNAVNETDFEEIVGGLIRGTAKLVELEPITYEGTVALSIYVTYPDYDGAFKGVYSLEFSDYGQPLYIYRRSGCRDCDIQNRTSIPEIEIHNITYIQKEYSLNEYIPMPSSFEQIQSDMGETMEIHHHFLMDSSFNSIADKNELTIPIKDTDSFDMPGASYTAGLIPEPYKNFVRIGDEPKISFSNQTFGELKQRSIAMNHSVTDIVAQAKKAERYDDGSSHHHAPIAMAIGGILMATGGIITIRKKKITP